MHDATTPTSDAATALQDTIPTSRMDVLPGDKKAGWDIQLFNTDGDRIHIVDGVIGLVIANNVRMGVTVAYGLTRGGFDGWQIHETGGGGSVTTPFAIINGVLYIGVVTQVRHTQGGPVDNTPRGYRQPGENALETAVREWNEEVETGDNYAVHIFELDGRPVNQNSANYETWGENEGVKYFACEISPNALEAQPDGSYVFRPDLLSSTNEAERKKEAIFGARFIAAASALDLSDAFTIVATGRIINHLSDADRKIALC